jgi:hypothetical protein
MAKRAAEQSVLERLTVGDVEDDVAFGEHPLTEIPLFSLNERWMLLPWGDILRALKEAKAVSIQCEPQEFEPLKQAIGGAVEIKKERALFRYDGRTRRLWAWLWNVSPFYGVPVENNDGEVACDYCRITL